MTERLPYEEQLAQQWNDCPLPDIDMAWADMKRRLDEDDDRPLLPVWWRGCAGWLLLGLLAAGLAWWILRPEKWFMSNNKPAEKVVPVQNKLTVIDQRNKDTDTTMQHNNMGSNDPDNIKNQPGVDLADSNHITIQQGGGKITKQKSYDQKDQQEISTGQARIGKQKLKPAVRKQQSRIQEGKDGSDKKDTAHVVKTVLPDEKNKIPDTLVTIVKKNPVNDSSQKKPADSIVKKINNVDSSATATKKDSTKKKKSFYVSVGLGLHQQLPVAGQSWTPYSAQGRKASLADYIPAVYIRLHREEKWFLQTGFRYGAPQLVKELVFSSKADTLSIRKYNKTNTRLQKTFYHQLPFTFNYVIAKKLSLGAGITWNRFASAVSLRDVIQHDRFTGLDTALTTNVRVTTNKPDSNFVASYFQASIEAQYKWKRFSFGANYSFGLQPYIHFVLQGGQPQEQKNRALQIFLRFELWRSKKANR